MNIQSIIANNYQQPRAALIACGLAGILLVGSFMYAANGWYHDWILAHHEVKAAPLKTNDETTEMIAAIPADHLFGHAINAGQMPISSLQLRVTGIVKVNDGSKSGVSKAYISISSQPSKIYQVGDTLPYGVKVYEITDDTVILENDSKLEKLPLPREPLEFKSRSSEEIR